MRDFLKIARLRKAGAHEGPNMQIDLIEPFWNIELKGENVVKMNRYVDHLDLATPIITYADLIETGDARNLDAAKRLRENDIR